MKYLCRICFIYNNKGIYWFLVYFGELILIPSLGYWQTDQRKHVESQQYSNANFGKLSNVFRFCLSNMRVQPCSAYAKFFEKLPFLTTWYSYTLMRIRGLEMSFFFRNIFLTYSISVVRKCSKRNLVLMYWM